MDPLPDPIYLIFDHFPSIFEIFVTMLSIAKKWELGFIFTFFAKFVSEKNALEVLRFQGLPQVTPLAFGIHISLQEQTL